MARISKKKQKLTSAAQRRMDKKAKVASGVCPDCGGKIKNGVCTKCGYKMK